MAAALGAHAVATQGAFRFVYRPDIGHEVRVVHDVRGTLRLLGIPNVRDGQILRYESIVGVTEVAERDLDGATMVETTFDSVFARYQSPQSSAWIELPIPYVPREADVRISDSLLRKTPVASSEDLFFLNAARGLRMTADVPFPQFTVSVGGNWPVKFDFPITSQIPSDSALMMTVEFVARGTARLDSIRTRATDTLAFVSVSAALDELTLSRAFSHVTGDLPVALSGSLVSSHIWSTGWQAWASSSSFITVDHRVEGLVGATMTTTLVANTRIIS